MQFEFLFRPFRRALLTEDSLLIGARTVPIRFVPNRKARRYILRVKPDGSARVTIPRGGSQKAAREFANRHIAWVEKQLQKSDARPATPAAWTYGTRILFRGEEAVLSVDGEAGRVRVADQSICVSDLAGNLRSPVERHFWRLAEKELVPRTWELAALHQLKIQRVTVRNQRSRWGSCSAKGTISLNWRLIQAPAPVQDYIILHELMHLREMNHSRRFWRHVEQVCPSYRESEAWLKQHGRLLR